MAVSPYKRALPIALGAAGAILLTTGALGVLYWGLMPEISLISFVERVWPYLPLPSRPIA